MMPLSLQHEDLAQNNSPEVEAKHLGAAGLGEQHHTQGSASQTSPIVT